jgi:hypothetical protein
VNDFQRRPYRATLVRFGVIGPPAFSEDGCHRTEDAPHPTLPEQRICPVGGLDLRCDSVWPVKRRPAVLRRTRDRLRLGRCGPPGHRKTHASNKG